MPDETPASGGQAPAGSQPQAGIPTATPQAGEPQSQQQPPAGQMSAQDYERVIAELRKENAGHRTKLSAYEKAQADADAAKLSELDRAQKKAADAERAHADLLRTHQERVIRYEVMLGASRLGIVDPDAAVKLLDWSEIEYDQDGQPQNLEKLLTKLLESKPYLRAQQQPGQPAQPPRPAPSAGGASAPARSQTPATPEPGRKLRTWNDIDWSR